MSPEQALAENNQSVEASSKTRLRLWLKILKTSKLIEAEIRDNLRTEFNSTLPRFDVMAALYQHQQGLKMSKLSGVLKVSNGNVTCIIDRLVSEKLVVRVPVEGDRRAMIVKLTNTGQQSFLAMAKVHESWIDSLLNSIDIDKADQLIGLLAGIEDNLDHGETQS